MQKSCLYLLAVFGRACVSASNNEASDDLYVRDLSSDDIGSWNDALLARDVDEAYKALSIRDSLGAVLAPRVDKKNRSDKVCFLLADICMLISLLVRVFGGRVQKRRRFW